MEHEPKHEKATPYGVVRTHIRHDANGSAGQASAGVATTATSPMATNSAAWSARSVWYMAASSLE
jgi:hypothetical protein